MSIKVRFAPSPTGYLHVGGLRTALYNYLYAKKVNGKIILRIEDTDQSRMVENAFEKLVNSFDQLSITFDEGPKIKGHNNLYFQSNRLSIYNSEIKKLIDKKYAYPCFCTSDRLDKLRKQLIEDKKTIKYDRHCLQLTDKQIIMKMEEHPYVIRMKIPSKGEVSFYDVVREKVSINCSEIDDQILIKSDGFPTYHFANVVDDYLMGITHVIRGEEWLPSTPKHVLLYEYFNWKLPKFIHLPLLLNPDKSKLSKRQGDVAVESYLKKGYLSEAIINFVALLGWHPKSDQEIFSIQDLEKQFSIKKIQKSGAVFDLEKLKWMNSQYLMTLPIKEIAKRAKPFFDKNEFDLSNNEKYLKVIDNARNRVNTLSEMPKECIMFYKIMQLENEDKKLINSEDSKALLSIILKSIKLKTDINGDQFKKLLMEIGKLQNISGKKLFFPIRVALYGQSKGPDIPLIFSILGYKEVINRLEKSIND